MCHFQLLGFDTTSNLERYFFDSACFKSNSTKHQYSRKIPKCIPPKLVCFNAAVYRCILGTGVALQMASALDLTAGMLIDEWLLDTKIYFLGCWNLAQRYIPFYLFYYAIGLYKLSKDTTKREVGEMWVHVVLVPL